MSLPLVAPPRRPAARTRPVGTGAGSPLSRVDGPEQALGLVVDELDLAERELVALVQSDVRRVPEVAGYLVASGGKRLRPALTALGARAIGWDKPVVRLMCVGELLHLGSLLHDDVVDDGELRRDRPAAQRVFGNPVAVLTGDFCLARAVLLAAEEGGFEVVRALGHVVTEMAEGEVLQLERAGDLSCTVPQYLEVVARKSAALIAWCVCAPALAAGDLESADALERFGRAVGVAFQITDDVLDYAPDTGKTRGKDLEERKVTLPLIHAMAEIPGLRDELAEGAPSPAAVERIVREVRASGALERSLAEARARVEVAIDALDAVPEGIGREALEALARYLVERAR